MAEYNETRMDKKSIPESTEGEQPVIPELLPVMPFNDFIVFPMMVLPILVNRDDAVAAIDAALAQDRIVLLVAEKSAGEEEPQRRKNFYEVGTAAAIIRMLKLPDGRTRVIVQGLMRARVKELIQEKPYSIARIARLEDAEVTAGEAESTAWIRDLRESLERAISMGKTISPEILMFAANVEDPGRLADLAATTLDLDTSEAQKLLEETDPLKRLKSVHKLYSNELQVLAVKQRIASQAKDEIEKGQRVRSCPFFIGWCLGRLEDNAVCVEDLRVSPLDDREPNL